MQGALLARHLASKGNPLQEVCALEERVRVLTNHIRTLESTREKLAKEVSECRKVVHDMSVEADARGKEVKELKERVIQLKKENEELLAGLARADNYIKECERMSRSSWNALRHTRKFLANLGVHSPEPNHEAGDGLKSFGWIIASLRAAASAVQTFGDHCARVAWTSAFHIMHIWAQPQRKEIRTAATQLRESCQNDSSEYL